MTITIDYPVKLTFETHAKLPIFKYGCPFRTAILQNKLKEVGHDTHHAIEDFIVEDVERNRMHETWLVGS